MEVQLQEIIHILNELTNKEPINIEYLVISLLISFMIGLVLPAKLNRIIRFENKFALTLRIMIIIIFILISLVTITSILKILNINTGINILSFSALGLMFSVILTMLYNFYLKEEEDIITTTKSYAALVMQQEASSETLTQIRYKSYELHLNNISTLLDLIIEEEDKKTTKIFSDTAATLKVSTMTVKFVFDFKVKLIGDNMSEIAKYKNNNNVMFDSTINEADRKTLEKSLKTLNLEIKAQIQDFIKINKNLPAVEKYFNILNNKTL